MNDEIQIGAVDGIAVEVYGKHVWITDTEAFDSQGVRFDYAGLARLIPLLEIALKKVRK